VMTHGPVNLVGMTMWTACEGSGTTMGFSTSTQVARLQPVRMGGSPCTRRFQRAQGSIGRCPQSTALITTIRHIHHFSVPVIAASYNEPQSMKVRL
jgi:hypothetical protein